MPDFRLWSTRNRSEEPSVPPRIRALPWGPLHLDAASASFPSPLQTHARSVSGWGGHRRACVPSAGTARQFQSSVVGMLWVLPGHDFRRGYIPGARHLGPLPSGTQGRDQEQRPHCLARGVRKCLC